MNSAAHLVIKQERVVVECQSDGADYQVLLAGSALHPNSLTVAGQTLAADSGTRGIGPGPDPSTFIPLGQDGPPGGIRCGLWGVWEKRGAGWRAAQVAVARIRRTGENK